MAIDSRYKMSQERLDTLKEELHYLETTREKEVAELIKEARSFGDLSENSEYDEAKTEQGKLYSRIAEVEEILGNCVVIEDSDDGGEYVRIGSTVTVLDKEFDADFSEAVARFAAGDEKKGKVIDVVQTGYMLGEKVLRFAKVVVGE